MKKAAIDVRVTNDQQTVENQLLVLNEVAQRSGWIIDNTLGEEGISGAKSRDQFPGYDGLLRAMSRRDVDRPPSLSAKVSPDFLPCACGH